jgi:hypothetical protein
MNTYSIDLHLKCVTDLYQTLGVRYFTSTDAVMGKNL